MDNQLDQTQQDQEQLVAQWLLSTPGFFERHPELLAQIELANTHSGKAISLHEKQMALLRNQNRDLNQRLSEMLRFGTENDRTQTLMIQWLEGLFVAENAQSMVQNISSGLNQLFEVGHVQIIPQSKVSKPLEQKLESEPIYGKPEAVIDLLDQEFLPEAGSLILIQLRRNEALLGVLLLSSADENKFSAQMGLFYIHQLAQLASAALYRFRDE
jgi:uncharacterized protein